MPRPPHTNTKQRWYYLAPATSATIVLLCLIFYAPAVQAVAEKCDSQNVRKGLSLLGQALFFDARLSADRLISCASCHRADHHFADDVAVSRGVFRRQGTRNTPSLVGASVSTAYFWDGRRTSLVDLVLNPLTHPNEHGMSKPQLESAVRTHYHDDWYLVFGDTEVTIDRIASALTSFVQTLTPAESSFEKFAYHNDFSAMTEAQRRGYQLFVGRAECSKCHLIRSQDAPLTDGQYHMGETSVVAQEAMILAALQISQLPQEERFALVASDAGVSALGRYTVTLQPQDVGLFRTPSLRNVAGTPPYMHDGSVANLREAVEHEIYWRAPEDARLGRMTPAERADIVEFLGALTSESNDVDVPSSDLGQDDLVERSEPTGKTL